MPVNFDEYRSNRREAGDLPVDPGSNAYKVLSFLAEHAEYGFKPSEILERVDIPKGSVNPTLGRLEERGLVDHEAPYWSAGDDDRLAAIAGTMYSMRAFETEHEDDDFGGWHGTDVDPRERR